MTAFHPDLEPSARWLPRGVGRPWFVALNHLFTPLLQLGSGRGRRETVPGGQSVVVYEPEGAPKRRPAMLWIHGGGLLFGVARQDEAFCVEAMERLGIVVATAEYRPGPQAPFPAALEDCYAALVWLSEQPTVDPARIVVAGSSAGGGLAAAVCLLARERGAVKPAFQLLVYPMLDDRTTGAGMDPDAFRVWDRRSNALGWKTYLAGQPPTALAAPARCEDLSGLPPAWIGVGTLDLFHDEDVAYAARLEQAGVPCTLEVVPGAYHGFDAVLPTAPVSRAFRESQLAAVAQALAE